MMSSISLDSDWVPLYNMSFHQVAVDQDLAEQHYNINLEKIY